MRHPSEYKTRFGLYRATARAMEELTTFKKAWYIEAALFHCEKNFPDLLPQLEELVYRPATLADLDRINPIKDTM